MREIEDKVLKQYFKEIEPFGKDLSGPILQKIQSQKKVLLLPAAMPPFLLWGITGVLMLLLVFGLSQVDNISFNLLENIQFPSFSTLSDLEVAPISLIIMPTLAIVIWIIILMEKKIMNIIH